jgi:hypothetical protein
MLIKELQSYFDRNNGNSKVENTMSLANHFSQFIELNSYFENGTIERVNEASKSATEIFQRLFKNEDSEVLALIYEFPEPNCFNAKNEYLHSQFQNVLEEQIIPLESYKIYVYKTKLKDINWKNILKAIANTEMGFEPAIDQKIYFFDIEKNASFHMSDDRGFNCNGL